MNPNTYIQRIVAGALVALLSAGALVAQPVEFIPANQFGIAGPPAHYTAAYQLVTDLLSNPANVNIYDTDRIYDDNIDWVGNPRTAITVCGTFITLLMKHTYGFTDGQYTAKTGSSSPDASQYHDAIVAQSGFTRIATPDQLKVGDIIAMKYPVGSDSGSGHVMMLQSRGPLQPRANSTQTFLSGGAEPTVTGFYDITVIDSSASTHGPTDTRYTKPGGIGRNGIARIYVNNALQIQGYTWTTSNGSTYRKPSQNYTMVIGRVNQWAW